jgi:hypothetical protein
MILALPIGNLIYATSILSAYSMPSDSSHVTDHPFLPTGNAGFGATDVHLNKNFYELLGMEEKTFSKDELTSKWREIESQ